MGKPPYECAVCGRLLCRRCFGNSHICSDCAVEETSLFEVTLLLPAVSWEVEAVDEEDARAQVERRGDYTFLISSYSGEPYELHVVQLDDDEQSG